MHGRAVPTRPLRTVRRALAATSRWPVLAFPALALTAVVLDSVLHHAWVVALLWAAVLAGCVALPAAFAVVAQLRATTLTRQVQEMRAHEDDARREIASMAHDLKGPLNTVSSYLDLIAEGVLGPVSEDARDAARSAAEAQSRARDLVESTLLRHVEASAARPVAAHRIDLRALIQDVTDALRAEIAASHAEVTVEPLPPVLGDATLLFRVFENLLQNAVKYARPGEAPVVAISGRREGDRAEIAVADHGIGIPPAERERVFDGAARAANGLAVAGGHGLGLATVRRLVHDLGGEVWVDPACVDGATLRLSLPVAV